MPDPSLQKVQKTPESNMQKMHNTPGHESNVQKMHIPQEWVEAFRRAFEGERDRLIQSRAQGERMDVRVCYHAGLSAVIPLVRKGERERLAALERVVMSPTPQNRDDQMRRLENMEREAVRLIRAQGRE